MPASQIYTNIYGTGGSSACTCCGPNWLVQILPQLEQKDLYDNVMICLDGLQANGNACSDCSVNGTNSINGVAWTAVGPTIPAILQCPSSEVMPQLTGVSGFSHPIAKGNYAGNWGNLKWQPASTTTFTGSTAGMFEVVQLVGNTTGRAKVGFRRGIRQADILDGSSKTMIASEILGVSSAKDGRGAWTWAAMGATFFTAVAPPNAIYNQSTPADVIPFCDNSVLPPKSPLYGQQSTSALAWTAAARSNHSGLVNVAMADGSNPVDQRHDRPADLASNGHTGRP